MRDPRRYRWIALDLDDTLLGPDRIVGPRARRAVQLVQDSGGLAVLATGRPYASAEVFARHLGLTGPVIANSGAVIGRPGGSLIRALFLDPDLVQFALEDAVARDLVAYLYTRYRTTATREHADTARYARILEVPISVDDRPDVRGVYAVCLRIPPEDGDQIEAELRGQFGSRAIVLRSLPSLIEILPPGATKGEALKYLAGLCDLSMGQLVAVGDGAGDLDMLEAAGLGVLVANAPEALWRRADAVTEEPYDRGVLELVRRLFGGGPGE